MPIIAVGPQHPEKSYLKLSRTAGITTSSVIRKNRKNAQWTTGRGGPWSVHRGKPVCQAATGGREVQGELTTGRAARGPLGIFTIFMYHDIDYDTGRVRHIFKFQFNNLNVKFKLRHMQRK